MNKQDKCFSVFGIRAIYKRFLKGECYIKCEDDDKIQLYDSNSNQCRLWVFKVDK